MPTDILYPSGQNLVEKFEKSRQMVQDLFERYLTKEDRNEIADAKAHAETERDDFWEQLWSDTFKKGKSYVKEFLPPQISAAIEAAEVVADAGKDLLNFDIAGFLKGIVDKAEGAIEYIPNSITAKITEACTESKLFMTALENADPKLAVQFRKKQDFKHLVKALQTLGKKDLNEWQIAEMIKVYLSKKIPSLDLK